MKLPFVGVLDFTERKGYLVPPLAMEEAVTAVHHIESNLRTELVYLQLEMAGFDMH